MCHSAVAFSSQLNCYYQKGLFQKALGVAMLASHDRFLWYLNLYLLQWQLTGACHRHARCSECKTKRKGSDFVTSSSRN